MIMSIDDSEEKMVFLVKIRLNQQDLRPKLVAYLTSIPKTLNKIFTGGFKFQDEVLYQSNILIAEEGITGDFQLMRAFFHKDFGIFMNLTKSKNLMLDDPSAGEKKSILFYLPRTSLFTGKDTNQMGFSMHDLYI